MKRSYYTAIVREEDSGFVSLCPELDVASQGDTIEIAVANLKEAVELLLETAPQVESHLREHRHIFVTQFKAVYS